VRRKELVEAAARQRLVVHQEGADHGARRGRRMRASVPPPGAGSTSSDAAPR
jgi:hypothetical protein